MEILAILIGFFFVIVVPGLAIVAFSRANGWKAIAARLEEQIGYLRRDLDHLSEEIKALRRAPEAPEQPIVQARPARAATRKTRQDTIKVAPETTESTAADIVSPWASPVAIAVAEVAPVAPTAPPIEEPAAAVQQAIEPPRKPARDLEEIIGTRWAVWVGGLALAIGGLFLVRYSIEAGIFGPRVRLGMAAIFSALLVAGGEALRRGVLMPRRIGESLGALPAEHVPLALTAAGVISAFGTVYAAYAVYGFLSQAVAFLLMGAIGIGAIVASLLHGQALAGIGLLASYATPILVGGESRSRWPPVIFLLVVTAAALAVQNRLRSVWLAWGAIVGIGIWSLLVIVSVSVIHAPELTLLTGAMALFAGGLVWMASPSDPETPVGDSLPLVALIGLAAGIGFAFLTTSGSAALFTVFALVAIVVLTATALRDGRSALAIFGAALLPLGMILTWPTEGGDRFWLVRLLDGAMLAFVKVPAEPGWLAGLAAAAGTILLVAPLGLVWRRVPIAVRHSGVGLHIIAFTSGLAPVILAFGWALRSGVRSQDLPIAALFLGLALLLGFISDRLFARRVADGSASDPDIERIGAGAYASGAALSLGLAIAFALPGLWMAVGFAAAALGISLLNDRRPLPALRRVAAAFATTAVLRGISSPAVFGSEAWPVFNWYIVAYAAPAVALGAGAFILRRQAVDRPVRVLEGSALLALAAFAFFEIRHGFHAASVTDARILQLLVPRPAFHEIWVFMVAGALFTALGLWLRRKTGGAPADAAWVGGGGVSVACAALGFGVLHNPFVHGIIVDGYVILNRLTLGYGIGVLALGATAVLLWRDALTSPARILGATAAALTAFWVVTQIRMSFHGGDLHDGNLLGLGEAGVYTLALIGATLALALGAERFPAVKAYEIPLPGMTAAANVLALVACGLLCVIGSSPWLDYPLSGPAVLDSSFVGYLLTGSGFGLLAWLGRTRPEMSAPPMDMANRIAGIGLVYLYLVTQVRRHFAGLADFTLATPTDGEQYAYSFVTLAFGVVLLAIGFKLASRQTRLASAVFVTLAVAKVFLFDMAGLTGLLRAFSFIGLGAVLIGIGLVYQRLLFDRKPAADTGVIPP